jgi:sialidase-1
MQTHAVASDTWVLVDEGQAKDVRQLPGPWRTGEGVLIGEQMGQFLFGGMKLLEGDVSVRLRMSIEQFDGTATAFVLDGNNYVGFDSRSGAIFLEGPRFSQDKALKIGDRDALLDEGEPFELLIERNGGVISISINGQLLRKVADPAEQFGTIGVRTHRAKIAVRGFSARGNAEPLSDDFAFDKPSVVFEMPDLTSLQPVQGVETMVIWESGTDGYDTYRIPSIIKTQAGTLLAFCEGRKHSRSDTGDIDLVIKRSEDGGQTWSPQMVLWDDGENVCGNPCPVVDQRTGDIVLLLTRNPGSEHERDIQAGTAPEGRTVWVCRSSDDGRTWTSPRQITHQTKASDWRWYATGPGVGIQLRHGPHAGRLVIPSNHSRPDPADPSEAIQGSHALYSDDGGENWAYSEQVFPECNESQMVELSDGRLMLNMRSYGGPKIRRVAYSSDGGETWTRPAVSELIEPRCQASMILFDPGEASPRPWVLFSNPATDYSRRELVVRASPDDGDNWTASRMIEPRYAAYSCLVQLDERTVGCLYEASKPGRPYQWIALARFDWDWLSEGPAEQP